VKWADPEVAIPLTFSIADGLAFGFTAFTLMKVLRGRTGKSVGWCIC